MNPAKAERSAVAEDGLNEVWIVNPSCNDIRYHREKEQHSLCRNVLLQIDQPTPLSLHKSAPPIHHILDLVPRLPYVSPPPHEIAQCFQRRVDLIPFFRLARRHERRVGHADALPKLAAVCRVHARNEFRNARIEQGDLVTEGNEVWIGKGFFVALLKACGEILAVPPMCEDRGVQTLEAGATVEIAALARLDNTAPAGPRLATIGTLPQLALFLAIAMSTLPASPRARTTEPGLIVHGVIVRSWGIRDHPPTISQIGY